MNWYCVAGVRVSCGEDMCWPYPRVVEAAEAHNASLRQPVRAAWVAHTVMRTHTDTE